jgi:hypothetical protein
MRRAALAGRSVGPCINLYQARLEMSMVMLKILVMSSSVVTPVVDNPVGDSYIAVFHGIWGT